MNKVWEWHRMLGNQEQGLENVGGENSSNRELRQLGSFTNPFIMDYE